METNGWQEYKQLFKHVVMKMDSIDDKLETALIKIGRLEERSKIMALLFGAIGGGLSTVVVVAIKLLS